MGKNKGSFSKIINRVVTIFLLFTLMVTAGSFVLRHRINVRLDKLGKQLLIPSSQPLLSSLLLDLDQAENNFQKASNKGNAGDLASYQVKLDSIFRQLSGIIKRYQSADNEFLPESQSQIQKSLAQKAQLTQRIFILRNHFDSLLKVTTINDIQSHINSAKDSVSPRIRLDTVVSTRRETGKNGLFRRLKEALRSTQTVRILTVRERREKTTRLSISDARNRLAQLETQYGRMAASGQALVLANLNLVTELRQLINQLQDIDRSSYERSREATLKAYASATKDLNAFTGIALIAVLVFISMLLVYIRRAGWAERRLRVESKRAINLAGQKSAILAILSHEIRNKLMAVNGAVFNLKRSELTAQQLQKVNSINLSCGLMQETVNNILDVSKLEQGYTNNLVHEPFSPAEAITNAIEAMRFMAENKGLTIELQSTDADTTLIHGDSLRLKQVLLNLLSNAIKYTDQGGIMIAWHLELQDGDYRLDVKGQDTGQGIPLTEQAKLFTPYYQAGGHKPGTGLGLHLCRQFVRQQRGEIFLKSAPGNGSTFSFYVLYTA